MTGRKHPRTALASETHGGLSGISGPSAQVRARAALAVISSARDPVEAATLLEMLGLCPAARTVGSSATGSRKPPPLKIVG